MKNQFFFLPIAETEVIAETEISKIDSNLELNKN